MATSDVTIPLAEGGPLAGSLALPDGGSPHPAVVVLHEGLGLNDDIRRIASRFADEGYVALAPDLFSFGNKAVCMVRLLGKTGERRAVALVEQSREWLARRDDVDADRMAVIGFCLGGGFALATGVRGGVRAAAVNYGQVPKDATALTGVCPVVASYGGRDLVFGSHGQRLDEHLTALGVDHDVRTYANVGHSFLNDADTWVVRLPTPMRVGYSEPEAEDAWRRILAFFDEHVRA